MLTIESLNTHCYIAVEEFQKLQQAKETLTNEESRAHYDYWRRSKIMIPFTQWDALQDSLKMVSFSKYDSVGALL